MTDLTPPKKLFFDFSSHKTLRLLVKTIISVCGNISMQKLDKTWEKEETHDENKQPSRLEYSLWPSIMCKYSKQGKMKQQQSTSKFFWYKNFFWNKFEIYRPVKKKKKKEMIISQRIKLRMISMHIKSMHLPLRAQISLGERKSAEKKQKKYSCRSFWQQRSFQVAQKIYINIMQIAK